MKAEVFQSVTPLLMANSILKTLRLLLEGSVRSVDDRIWLPAG